MKLPYLVSFSSFSLLDLASSVIILSSLSCFISDLGKNYQCDETLVFKPYRDENFQITLLLLSVMNLFIFQECRVTRGRVQKEAKMLFHFNQFPSIDF